MQAAGRVLLADDEPAFLSATAAHVERAGYTCRQASDADEVYAWLQREDFDALVTDIDMPGNEDLEMVRRVRERIPGLPVILVTGRPTFDTAHRSVGLAVAAYLLKPFRAQVLLDQIADACRLRSVQRALGEAQQQLDESGQRLAEAELLLARPADPGAAERVYLETMLNTVLTAINQLQTFIATAGPASASQAGLANGLAADELVLALHETVSVLEQTKSHFRSKDLARLRHRVEDVLGRLGQPRP